MSNLLWGWLITRLVKVIASIVYFICIIAALACYLVRVSLCCEVTACHNPLVNLFLASPSLILIMVGCYVHVLDQLVPYLPSYQGIHFLSTIAGVLYNIIHVVITVTVVEHNIYREVSTVHCQVLLQVCSMSNNTRGNEWVMLPWYMYLMDSMQQPHLLEKKIVLKRSSSRFWTEKTTRKHSPVS